MPTAQLAGKTVEVNDEGFLVDPNEWTEEMATELAEQHGVATPLTDRHWVVINYMRKEYFENGTGATVRKLGKASGVQTKELFKLFPKGPAKISAMVAGIPKPKGCI
jgi:tRNA 2-thiouridine synthesizing protein E